jgi:tRNA(Arg) A34 adenosine deaminase TadA
MSPETVSENDTRFMTEALGLAQTALVEGEFPVGCVIATNDRWLPGVTAQARQARIGKRDRPR